MTKEQHKQKTQEIDAELRKLKRWISLCISCREEWVSAHETDWQQDFHEKFTKLLVQPTPEITWWQQGGFADFKNNPCFRVGVGNARTMGVAGFLCITFYLKGAEMAAQDTIEGLELERERHSSAKPDGTLDSTPLPAQQEIDAHKSASGPTMTSDDAQAQRPTEGETL